MILIIAKLIARMMFMTRQMLQIIIALVVSLLLVSTVAYAYIGPELVLGSKANGMISNTIKDGDSSNVAVGISEAETKETVESSQVDSEVDSEKSVVAVTDKTVNSVMPAGSNSEGQGSKPDNTIGKPLSSILQSMRIANPIPNLKIVADKTSHLLTLYSGTTPIKSYKMAIGDGGLADKHVLNDHKTPEGTFYIAEKSVLTPADKFLGTRWMRISYPNIEDAGRGLNSGLIDQATYDSIVAATNNRQIPPQKTALGGGVGIHGGNDTNGPNDWTWGCLGLNNADVNEIYDFVSVGTPLIIQH